MKQGSRDDIIVSEKGIVRRWVKECSIQNNLSGEQWVTKKEMKYLIMQRCAN
jgi:hypothetical protein